MTGRWRDTAATVIGTAVDLLAEAAVWVITGGWRKPPAPPDGAVAPARAVPGHNPAPGNAGPRQRAAESPSRPSPAPACQLCGGSGWAVVLDPVLEDAYSIACPGGCPIPAGWPVPEVPF